MAFWLNKHEGRDYQAYRAFPAMYTNPFPLLFGGREGRKDSSKQGVAAPLKHCLAHSVGGETRMDVCWEGERKKTVSLSIHRCFPILIL